MYTNEEQPEVWLDHWPSIAYDIDYVLYNNGPNKELNPETVSLLMKDMGVPEEEIPQQQ